MLNVTFIIRYPFQVFVPPFYNTFFCILAFAVKLWIYGFQSSPLPFNPAGRTNDIDALLNVIQHAEKFIYIAVMDYFPLTIFSPKMEYWPKIDDALKAAAIEHHVKVKMLISYWNHSRPSEDKFLKSLASLNEAYPRVSIEIVSIANNNYPNLNKHC